MNASFGYLLLSFLINQNLVEPHRTHQLVPILFSEAMDMHPVAIILAVLVFGGIWGFWGVLLAIPLATVVKAILTFWPRKVY